MVELVYILNVFFVSFSIKHYWVSTAVMIADWSKWGVNEIIKCLTFAISIYYAAFNVIVCI